MEKIYIFVIIASLASLVVVLCLGLKNMALGGSSNKSQRLMRLRVLFQGVAVCVLMLGLFIFGN